jgi:hypothetical protein
LTRLEGTFAVKDGVATVKMAMIEGELGASAMGVIHNLSETARAAGATTLRIEATLANESLFKVFNARYGIVTEGAIDVITIPLGAAR